MQKLYFVKIVLYVFIHTKFSISYVKKQEKGFNKYMYAYLKKIIIIIINIQVYYDYRRYIFV